MQKHIIYHSPILTHTHMKQIVNKAIFNLIIYSTVNSVPFSLFLMLYNPINSFYNKPISHAKY